MRNIALAGFIFLFLGFFICFAKIIQINLDFDFLIADMVKGSQQLQLKQHADVGTVDKSKCFVGVALATRSNLKKPLSSETDNTPKEFLSKHTLDGKFLYVDTRLVKIWIN